MATAQHLQLPRARRAGNSPLPLERHRPLRTRGHPQMLTSVHRPLQPPHPPTGRREDIRRTCSTRRHGSLLSTAPKSLSGPRASEGLGVSSYMRKRFSSFTGCAGGFDKDQYQARTLFLWNSKEKYSIYVSAFLTTILIASVLSATGAHRGDMETALDGQSRSARRCLHRRS